MKVILLKDVVKVGERGSVIDVRDGFGRNYLIRQGLARLADKEAIRNAEARKKAHLEKEVLKKGTLKEYAKTLSGYSMTFKCKANDKGYLFAGVSATDAAVRLHKDGYEFIRPGDLHGFPLKTIGEYSVSLRVGGEDIPFHICIETP